MGFLARCPCTRDGISVARFEKGDKVKMDIVAILGTGVSGFSFLMLLVGYQLTSKVQNKILDANLANFDKDRMEAWNSIATKQLANTRYFMLFSTIFLLAGLGVLMLTSRPEATIVLSVTPAEAETPPRIFAQEIPVKLEHGRVKVTIKSDQGLTIQNDELVKQLSEERMKRREAEIGQRVLAQQTAAVDRTAGFGFEKDNTK